ncbi:hypothetical protein COCCADRAFT_33160 [Bipolaris zeicola 26-R-13]|uniref:Uncharacterized protein n=1 Tax=Cochliobolus carbonum (strain 26-R-13) TaxID=930089 RepID=W6YQ92_COCC2|nr:uncharacterized protein COCCADRAFT_33160 [Bipolaris zeicola 26-R-13]EUC37634.1 hypothetical protein COCCADRAFT_33160 [Bipolaris zeicola 26-R-13]
MGQSTPGDMFRGSLLGVSSGLIPRPNCTVASPLSRGTCKAARHPLPIGATHAAHFAGCGCIAAAQRLPPFIHPSIHPGPRLASPCTHRDKPAHPPVRPSIHPALEQFATTHQTTIAGRARGPPPFRAGAPRSTPLATVDHVTHRCLLSTHFHIPTCTTHFIRAYTSACMHTSSPMSG